MSKFTTHLIIQPSEDEKTATLIYPLVYQSDLIGEVTVPAGFSTDFASVPRVIWSIVPPVGLYGEPAIVHDYLYRTQLRPRKVADNVFLEAMQAQGCDWLQRHTIYRAVRMFGWLAWRHNASMKKNITIVALLCAMAALTQGCFSVPQTEITYGTFKLTSPKQVEAEQIEVSVAPDGTKTVKIKGLASKNDNAVLAEIAKSRAEENAANWQGMNTLAEKAINAAKGAALTP